MRLELENAGDFKKCIDAISVLIDEAELIVNDKGLELKATDPSQISMVDFVFPKEGFKKFDLKKETRLGLDLDYFSQVMSRTKSDDALVIDLPEGESSLKITFKGGSTRSFSIPLIDVSAGEIPSPKIDFDAVLKLNSRVLGDALKDAQLIATHVLIEVNETQMSVKANSSKGKLENITDKKEMQEFKVKADSRAMFPLDYLTDMLKGAGTELVLSMKSNAPIKLDYEIGKAKITYFLAPRIESD
ncbi:MAG: proliferating cell nuclear antigen (pcna) [Candidatus Diapherotrites archaeon]